MAHILVVDDEDTLRRTLAEMLADEGYDADGAADGEQAIQKAASTAYDCIICDIKMPRMDGLEFLRQFRVGSPSVPALLMTAFANLETAAQAVCYGATDYLIKPVDFDDLLARLKEALRQEESLPESRVEVAEQRGFAHMVGVSPGMQDVYEAIRHAAPSDCTALVTGESGTGKELVARALHAHSNRADGPFIPFNCCCRPSDLIDSELFGHLKGAFTGAADDKPGLFRAAEGGTLFLDEISGLPSATQGKVLRAVEFKEIMPVGSGRPLSVDTRLVVATNRDLREMVETHEFREDLYYRLSVVLVELPPLRQRRGDIALLVAHFMEGCASRLGIPLPQVQPEALRMMQNYRWPGNVRELKNIIERTLIMRRDDQLRAQDLPREMMLDVIPGEAPTDLRSATRLFERYYVEAAVRRAGGDKVLAAKRLGVALSSLYRKLEEPSGPEES